MNAAVYAHVYVPIRFKRTSYCVTAHMNNNLNTKQIDALRMIRLS